MAAVGIIPARKTELRRRQGCGVFSYLTAAGALLFSGACAAADLTVTVENLRSNNGQVALCVFSAESSLPALFPDCGKGKAVQIAKAPPLANKAIFLFKGLRDGTYAVAMVHDENGNGELDTNILGIPVEGLGVSNNPRLMGKPSFAEAQFTIKGNTSINVQAKYFL
jgi:uncharacterized protein (DUF2141 family)